MQQLVRLSFRLSDLRTAVCDSPKLVAAVLLAALIPLAGCGTASPPTRQADICEVFRQYPDWYDYARKSASRWGTPIHVQMSFVRHESSYRGDARPPRQWFWFIPLGRPVFCQGLCAGTGSGLERIPGGAGTSVPQPAAIWKMPWTSSAGTTTEPGVSSAYHSPTRSASTSPTTKGKAVIGGAPGGTNRRCRVPPGGSLRRRIVTERSLRAVNPAFGATPGIKSGRSAANRRSAPSRYAGAPARKNPHARWRVFALKGVETTPRTQPRFFGESYTGGVPGRGTAANVRLQPAFEVLASDIANGCAMSGHLTS